LEDKYGSEYFVKSETFKKMMIEKYGTLHALQVPEFFHKMIKSCFSKKKYIFKNGREIEVMGYENIAIDYLLNKKDNVLKRNIIEDEVLVGEDVPVFDYLDDDNKKRKYYPDIYIKNTKLILEVKSFYTFNYNPRLNYLKFKQVQKDGYDLKVLIYGKKKKLIDVWYFLADGTTKSYKYGNEIEMDKCIIFNYEKDKEEIIEIDEDQVDMFILESLEDNLSTESVKVTPAVAPQVAP
jgi:hypothetical protein